MISDYNENAAISQTREGTEAVEKTPRSPLALIYLICICSQSIFFTLIVGLGLIRCHQTGNVTGLVSIFWKFMGLDIFIPLYNSGRHIVAVLGIIGMAGMICGALACIGCVFAHLHGNSLEDKLSKSIYKGFCVAMWMILVFAAFGFFAIICLEIMKIS